MLLGLIIAFVLALLGMLVFREFRRRKSKVLLEETMKDSKELDTLKMILGDKGIREHLPYLTGLLQGGDTVAIGLVLELLKDVPFEDKEAIMIRTFRKGSQEIKFQILDYIFAWHISYKVLTEIMEDLAPEVQEYLVKYCFLNLRELTESGTIAGILAKKEVINCKGDFSKAVNLMYHYLFYGQTESYDELLQYLTEARYKEDLSLAAQVMQSYLFMEDAINLKYLAKVIERGKDDYELLLRLAEVASEYDDSLFYLKKYFSKYYHYDYMDKICVHYRPFSILQGLSRDRNPVLRAYMLHSAAFLEHAQLKLYRYIADELLFYLSKLTLEIKKIEISNNKVCELLLEEVVHLQKSLTLVLLNYWYALSTGHRGKGIKKLFAETVALGHIPQELKEVLSAEQEQLLGRIIWPQSELQESPYDYSVLSGIDLHRFLENMYRYMGGELMDGHLSENIEKMIILKGMPMFRELDVMTLYQILQIASYKKLGVGETVVTEGEPGDSFFTIIEGTVGVYKGDRQIATVESGEMIGELAVIDKQPRTATVKTLEDTTLLVIEADDFIGLLEKSSSISLSVIKTLTGRFRNVSK